MTRPQKHFNLDPLSNKGSLTLDDSLSVSIDTPLDSDGGSLTVDSVDEHSGSDSSLDTPPLNQLRQGAGLEGFASSVGLNTIDEASDGLVPINLDTPLPELVFPDEPQLELGRTNAKLSDLSGVTHLGGVLDTNEPRFGGPDSLNRSQKWFECFSSIITRAKPQTAFKIG